MLNRDDLSVLLHATTGDDIFDRTYDAMWLGKRVRKFGDGGQQVEESADASWMQTVAPCRYLTRRAPG